MEAASAAPPDPSSLISHPFTDMELLYQDGVVYFDEWPTDLANTLHRMGICHKCRERPEGCWKAVAYDCQRKYRAAAKAAAETATCPIGKLK